MENFQFTNIESPFSWYALYYQSNRVISDEQHEKAKLFLAETLVNELNLEEIHSYFNGQLLFAIDTQKMMETYYEIIDTLDNSVPFFKDPSLAVAVNMVWRQKKLTDPSVYFIHVHGDPGMNEKFQHAVSCFWPAAESSASRSDFRLNG
jgi:hypothetical protein